MNNFWHERILILYIYMHRYAWFSRFDEIIIFKIIIRIFFFIRNSFLERFENTIALHRVG